MQTHRLLMRGSLLLVFALAAVVLSGCCTTPAEWVHNGFKVGPNYHQPPLPLSQEWIDGHDPRVLRGDPNLASWWEVFDDPILNKLLHDCYASNLTIKAAGFQIMEGRAQRAFAIGELLPQAQTAYAGFSRNQVSATNGIASAAGTTFGTAFAPALALVPVASPNTPIAGVVDPGSGTTSTAVSTGSVAGSTATAGASPNRFFTNISTSLNASWEFDFWGLFRRNLEAANAGLDQSMHNYDEMVVLLLANVATQYIEIRTLQKRLELARKNVALQEPLVSKYHQRYKTGIANSYPGYFQLKSNLDNTRALIPVLEVSLRQANNALCAYLGQPIHDLLPELGDGTVADPRDPNRRIVRIPRPRDVSVVAGIPGDFLRRRPDVLAAEDQLRIQSAQIGIAEAEFYPHIGINGSIGLASNNLATLFNTRSGTGTIGPSLTWNILNYGRILASLRFQNALFGQFVATYQQAVLNANQDAENAMVGYLKTLQQAENLSDSADAADKLTRYLLQQDKAGYLPPGALDTSAFINQLFTAINFQVTQQDSAAQAEGNVSENLILLYRAMGGGWQIRLNDPHSPCNGGDQDMIGWPPPLAPENTPSPAPPEVVPPPKAAALGNEKLPLPKQMLPDVAIKD